ncbi:hypothetical protein Hanom_Chr05g00464231 [Helianthus anomalus]
MVPPSTSKKSQHDDLYVYFNKLNIMIYVTVSHVFLVFFFIMKTSNINPITHI